jgi:hypothetical protein
VTGNSVQPARACVDNRPSKEREAGLSALQQKIPHPDLNTANRLVIHALSPETGRRLCNSIAKEEVSGLSPTGPCQGGYIWD